MNRFAVMLIAFSALCISWAQVVRSEIISTSLPSTANEETKPPVSAHFMVSPVGNWDYKDLWMSGLVDEDGNSLFQFGTVEGGSSTPFLAAAEVAIPVGGSRSAATIGGWYNRIGELDFDFDGAFALFDPQGNFLDAEFVTATIPISVTMLEVHAGFFYRSFGVQIGLVHSLLESDGDIRNIRFDDGTPFPDIAGVFPFDTSTTDWTLYGVYKGAINRWTFSGGLGAYMKQGIEDAEDSPLRGPEDKTVVSAFLTGGVDIWRRLSLDASFWYIGGTDLAEEFEGITSDRPSDAQSRLTVGVGYSL